MSKEEQFRMNWRLIPTKYAVPSLRGDDIVRDRLRLELDLALQYPLTLICAQAGSGKTTAVADWVRAYASCTAWLTLEEKDNDLPRFWRYLIAALHTIDPAIGQDMSIVYSLKQHLTNDALETLISAIVRRGERLIIVLDNFQEIHNPVIHRILSEWIANAPSFFHTILISRSEPQLPIETFRVRHQLKQISFFELRFNLQESSLFYRMNLKKALTVDQIQSIHSKTDGWATGLQLIALALKNNVRLHENLHKLIGNNPYIRTYFFKEIVAKQPADIRRFIFSISIFDRFSPELCQAIGGDDTGGASMLRIIVQNNLFITPLDDEQIWFKFHPLFAEVLRTRIADELPPDQINRLHHLASEWFEQRSEIQEAVQHAIAGGETGRAARLLATHAPSLLHKGESSQLLQWIETVKSDSCENFIPVSILQAKLLLLQGRYEEADAVFNGLEPSLEAAAVNEMTSERAILHMIQAVNQGDIEAVMGNMPLDTKHHEYISIIGEKNTEDVLLHRLLWGFCGRIATAERFFTEAAQLTDNYGPPSKLTGYVYATLGEIYYEWNQLEAALSCLEKGMAEGFKYDNWIVRISCAIALSRTRYAQGSRDGAVAVLHAMKNELRAAGSTRWSSALTAAEIRMEITDGQKDAVREWLSDLSSADRIASFFSTEFEQMTYVRALLSVGNVSQALELLEQLRWKADKEKRLGSQIEVTMLQALCFAKQRKEDLALAALEGCVRMAIQEQYTRLFVDEGEPMMELLLALHDCAPEEIKCWIQQQLLLLPKRTKNKIDDLTAQEMIILRKIATGMTNREISEQLSIAVGTVKAHTNKIYQKLGVKNRVQALQLTGFGLNHKQQAGHE